MKKETDFSPLHRLLHWAIALGILFMFLTVFLRSYWLNGRSVAAAIIANLAAKGIAVSQDAAMNAAKQISHPMWVWHVYVGYALVGLYLVRLIYLFVKGAKFSTPFAKNTVAKKKLQGWLYVAFYVLLAVIIITGLLLKFGAKSIHNAAHEIHEIVYYFMLVFVALHFIGIYIGEKTDEKGIVSKMIGGQNLN